MAFHRSYRAILRRLGAVLGRTSSPRQAHLYCCGAPRSGTHSIATIFDRSLRSRHEPQLRSAMQQVVAHHRGQVTFDELRRFVRTRAQRLGLDVDSSHVNAFLIDALLAEFEDARFLLTMRDCFSWTDSAMNHTVNSRQWSAGDRQYLEFYFDVKGMRYSPHDAWLAQRGLLSLDCYLAAWSRHNRKVLGAVPAAKLMVVKTHEISAQLAPIAAFAGVLPERLRPGFRATGRAKARHGILDRIDPAYLADRAAEHCGTLMRAYFPDVGSLRDARALEASWR